MKGNKTYVDIGSILDDVFEAAKDFGEKMKDFAPPRFDGCGPNPMGGFGANSEAHGSGGASGGAWFEAQSDENADYYPNFSYPPMNIYLTSERSIVFEFAVAGFEEKGITLSFQGDYMVFSAKIELEPPLEGIRYFKRRLKLKDIEKQKYYVPADKFDQEKVKAVFKNGILKVTVPPKETAEANEGIKIEIVREGE
ncbi:MAG TPA: Hsp20/alpha crystallin family protein [Spirochaetaceae bacterium]|nr:Hsp20/alpha crystallin family protein [Spirochaetaceae bacterium]